MGPQKQVHRRARPSSKSLAFDKPLPNRGRQDERDSESKEGQARKKRTSHKPSMLLKAASTRKDHERSDESQGEYDLEEVPDSYPSVTAVAPVLVDSPRFVNHHIVYNNPMKLSRRQLVSWKDPGGRVSCSRSSMTWSTSRRSTACSSTQRPRACWETQTLPSVGSVDPSMSIYIICRTSTWTTSKNISTARRASWARSPPWAFKRNHS